MAYRVSNGAGTAFNTAANWDEGVNTPTIHASTNIAVTAGGVTSATFTAPNTTNACTGVIVPIFAKGTAGNIIATLQESGVDVAGATATIAITSLVATTHVFFKFTTPFVFTSTAAGRYRIKLNTSGASGTTSVPADSGGANFAYIAFMDANTVPTTNDDVFAISPNQGAEHVMTLDTSPSFGSGTNTALASLRSWGNALVMANNGGISWPQATSRTVTLKGNIALHSGGKYRMGTAAAKINAGVTARLAFDQNGVSCNYGLQHFVGGEFTLQGADKTFKKTTLSSGVGTAASPFVAVDSVDWSVGDELVFVPVSNNATNYDETETRFIITKNSATSYVLSATSGGAEVAFTYSHTAGTVFNVTRQVIIDTTNVAQAWYADFAETVTASNINIDGARLETYGSATASKTSIIFSNSASEMVQMDDVVFYRGLGSGVGYTFSTNTITHTWLIFFDFNGTGNAGAFNCTNRNKTYTNCYVIDSQSAGFYPIGGAALSFNNCTTWACGRASATGFGGWYFQVFSLALDSCESHANRSYGFYHSNTASGNALNCQSGTKGTNGGADIFLVSDIFVDMNYESLLVGSSTFVSNYLNLAPGSVLSFHKLGDVANTHRWYTPGGIGRSVGPSLADTTTLKTGHLSARLDAEDSTLGISFETRVLARVGQSAMCFGMIQKNASMAADPVTVSLYLPGSSTPDQVFTMPTDTAANTFALGVPYPGTEPFFARIVVNAKSTTAGAYTYIGNFFNGTDVLNAFDLWYKGRPSDVMVEQAGDSQAVWAVLTSTLTTSGTTGYLLTKLLTVAKFLGLK